MNELVLGAAETIRDLYRDSLFRTAHDLLGYSDITGATHLDIIRCLESSTKRKLIVVPRGCFKSSLGCVAFPIWALLPDIKPRLFPNKLGQDLRILLDSEKYENSKNFIREIKGKLESPKLTELFGEFRSDFNWAEGSITVRQRSKVLKESSITAS